MRIRRISGRGKRVDRLVRLVHEQKVQPMPFESFNPTGHSGSAVARKEQRLPEADRATAKRVRQEVKTAPTTAANMGERLALLHAWAQSFLHAGRKAELDTVLPPEQFHQVRERADREEVEGTAPEIDRLLLGLADLLESRKSEP